MANTKSLKEWLAFYGSPDNFVQQVRKRNITARFMLLRSVLKASEGKKTEESTQKFVNKYFPMELVLLKKNKFNVLKSVSAYREAKT